jgi:hypothetical protein
VGRNKLNGNLNAQAREYKEKERLYSAISVGGFFILIGIIYVASLPQNLLDRAIAFFNSFTFAQIPTTGLYLPAPISPAAHAILYRAIFQFCIGLGILQVIMLALRLLWNSPIGKTAETMGHLVFWFGTSYLVATYLNSTANMSKWFVFWAGILVILGLSLVARAFVLLVKRKQVR